jgi:predicted RNase H-like HicB family nuclease
VPKVGLGNAFVCFFYFCSVKKQSKINFTITIETNKNGWLTGQCEELPKAISQGKDMDDLMENMKDAIELVLEVKRDKYRLLNNSAKYN